MEIKADLETLNKSLIYAKSMDTPDTIYAIVPEANPGSPLPKDQVRLESYVRLKSLPFDLMKLVLCITEARSISNKVAEIVPFLPVATPTHHLSGVVELNWKLDNGGMFGIILHGFSFSLDEEEGGFVVNRKGRITWRFTAPGLRQKQGEFRSVEELLEFMGKSFIDT